jgi:hypothetical protein
VDAPTRSTVQADAVLAARLGGRTATGAQAFTPVNQRYATREFAA